MFTAIQVPTHCPSCSSELTIVSPLLYCKNPSCGDQQFKKIEHFAKALKIKGLGPAAIRKLELVDFDQIYSLTLEEVTETLGSEKVAIKLMEEIKNSRSAPLELVLPAFGIPLIGNTATRKLSEIIENITDINHDNCVSAGLGPKATTNLISWLNREFYSSYDGTLPFSFKFSKKATATVASTGVVCISGKLKSFKTKADATEALESAGYQVKSSLTKQVTILVNESGIESAKTKQARDSGITIVTDLRSFLEN